MKHARNLLPLLFFILFSCSSQKSILPYQTGNEEADREVQALLALLDVNQDDTYRYGIMEQIISRFRQDEESEVLKHFLNDQLYRFPDDSYSGYYLLLLGTIYEEEGAIDIAAIYYNRLLKNYEDLIIRGQSIHYYSLNKLLKFHSDKPLKKIGYYNELLSRFSGDIDRGQVYYNLAKSYESEGLWDESIDNYKKFLEAPTTSIAGMPNVYNEVNHYLNFHYSAKEWTRDSLESLVDSIKYAIHTRNGSRLIRYRAEDFFMMSWGQDRYDPFTEIPMELAYFLKSSVWYNRELEADSNENEALLRTGGWSYRIKIWYLYFNRINYPIDPEINKRWEWAGIYFGDKL
ncbi:tetratricopeptide repeat protein [Oceanispirochaeta sp.]|jgi:tetratricopeptide (TPR) repeat protein|uniref:tetratricopeptide repeat protein n=1 Tax=Oceanispirochaeta sp. TaxID=2035350 RepID=UPI002639B17E|nr:tetratricopeptide repeat protein [Oceanispirochaeta sp.]MDA3958897.1 tetratricopeptide repeat protein [Oceanispirochaeta sp.]